MKINWGHKLLFVTILFMVFILSMVIYLSRQKVDLEEENYYEKGIKYQEVIDQSKDAGKLLKVSLNNYLGKNKDTLNEIIFKPLVKFDSVKCEISFFRPSEKNKDFSFSEILSDTNSFVYLNDKIDKGSWRINVSWEDKNGKHQLEKKFTLK